jgi:hypothetical protein
MLMSIPGRLNKLKWLSSYVAQFFPPKYIIWDLSYSYFPVNHADIVVLGTYKMATELMFGKTGSTKLSSMKSCISVDSKEP